MPTLLPHTTTGPMIACDSCRQDEMCYVNGVSFCCPTCGANWAPDWQTVLILDEYLSRLSIDDRYTDTINTIEQMALGEWQPIGDPDHNPDMGTLIDSLPGPLVLSTRLVTAYFAWRWNMDMYAEEYV